MYIDHHYSGTLTVSNAREYGKIVSEKATIRNLIKTADDIVAKGYEDSMNGNELMDFAESGIFEISKPDRRDPIRTSRRCC